MYVCVCVCLYACYVCEEEKSRALMFVGAEAVGFGRLFG